MSFTEDINIKTRFQKECTTFWTEIDLVGIFWNEFKYVLSTFGRNCNEISHKTKLIQVEYHSYLPIEGQSFNGLHVFL